MPLVYHESCKLNRTPSFEALTEYVKFLLENRPSKDMSDNEIAKLAPWDKAVQELCKNKIE